MPTTYIHMTKSAEMDENCCADLCMNITKIISEGIQRPANIVHTYIVELPMSATCGAEGASIAVQVFAHAGRSNEVKQAIGKEITNVAVKLGFPVKNIVYDFYDNPSGATFVDGSIRWAKNDPRANT